MVGCSLGSQLSWFHAVIFEAFSFSFLLVHKALLLFFGTEISLLLMSDTWKALLGREFCIISNNSCTALSILSTAVVCVCYLEPKPL